MMHTKILEKCLEELRKDVPRKDYVIGMLETLVEMDMPQDRVYKDIVHVPYVPNYQTTQTAVNLKVDEILTDEDRAYAQKMAGGPVAKLTN